MKMKEKVNKTLGGFLDRNKKYAIEMCIKNAITNKGYGQIVITSDYIYEADDNIFRIKWNKDQYCDVRYNEFSIPYDEIMSSYEEEDNMDNLKISETIIVILKNGIEFNFCCCGMRM